MKELLEKRTTRHLDRTLRGSFLKIYSIEKGEPPGQASIIAHPCTPTRTIPPPVDRRSLR